MFLAVIILSPVCFSISNPAFLAAKPPFRATPLFSSSPFGFYFFDISVVDASANILRTNSKFVILSRKFSFLNPLNFL